MKIPVIYVFTHDSIHVGEDGPTHQPVEQLESLRIFPGIAVFRPADALETALAWEIALRRTDGPTVLALSRQNLPVFERSDNWRTDCSKGAYVVRDGGDKPDIVIVATGSEVSVALEAAEKEKRTVRVVSMLSREIFVQQDDGFRKRIIPDGARVVVAEAAVPSGWEGIATSSHDILGLGCFGESGKAEEVAHHLGVDADGLTRLLADG